MTYLYFKGKQIGEYKRDSSGLALIMNDAECFSALLNLHEGGEIRVGEKRISFPLFVKNQMARTAAFYTSPGAYKMSKAAARRA